MLIQEKLDEAHAKYSLQDHKAAFTAQHLAQQVHVPGMKVAKSVVVKADDTYYLCVLPACCKINFDTLKSGLDAENITLVSENELQQLFPDCSLGSEPPFGSFYGLPTIMDDRLEKDDFIVFEAGTHNRSIKMDMDEYIKIEQPKIYSFSYHI